MAWAFTRICRNGVWRYLKNVDEVKSPRFLCFNINYENIFNHLTFAFIHDFLTSYMIFLTSYMENEFFMFLLSSSWHLHYSHSFNNFVKSIIDKSSKSL